MKAWAALLLLTLLAACATVPDPASGERFFSDAKFAPPSERIQAADVFAVSPEMRRYLETEIAVKLRTQGRQKALVDALYSKGQLKLDYDTALTRNAAQAFEARSGNCLSLVIMTAAFAKELGLTVHYQNVFTDDTWARSGDLHFVIDHINISLGKRLGDIDRAARFQEVLTVDFLPPKDGRTQRAWILREPTVVAMYMNNRAAESLARGRVDEAYWWAREAMLQDPGFTRAYNTLGVVYRRKGELALAERVLAHAMALEPSNPQIVFNLAQVYAEQGRGADAAVLKLRLAQLETEPPFMFFERGQAALREGNFEAARDNFAREVERAGYYHEFHYWLAVSYVKLGNETLARRHLTLAMDSSTTQSDHRIYAAKLEHIRASSAQ